MALPTTISNALLGSRQRHGGPFKSSGGNFYGIFESSTAGIIVAVKTTDPVNGSWSEQDSANRPDYSGNSVAFDVKQDGDNLHVATQYITADMTPLGAVRYHVFSMSSDTWTTTDETVVSPANVGNVWVVAIAIRSGNPVIFYQTSTASVMGAPYNRVAYARKSGGSWTSGIAVDGGGEVNYFVNQAVTGASDRVHFFYKQGTASGQVHRSLASDNTLDTASALGNNPINASGWGHPTAYDDGGTVRIRVTRSWNNSGSTVRFDSGANPTLAEDVWGDTEFPQWGVDVMFQFAVVRHFGSVNYVLFVDAAADDLYRIDSGDTYGTATAIESNIVATHLSGNVYTRGAATVFGYFINKTNLEYNEYVIDAGSPKSIAIPGMTFKRRMLRR